MKQERISTHVLDLSTGRPAAGVKVSLRREGRLVGARVTDADGRVVNLADEPLQPGAYRLEFEVGEYFGEREHLFTRIGYEFELPASVGHYHIPLLISPFSSTTYRGS
jgi:5-hydroxyisourate hydrolase